MNKIVSVNFRGNELYGFQSGDLIFVAVKPLVEGMGLDWSSQYKRLKRDPILSKGMVIMTIPFGRGGTQDQVCLRLQLINGWLFTIDSTRIKENDVRTRVLAYQAECYEVLFQYFSGEREKLLQEKYDRESLALRKVDQARLLWGNSAGAQVWHAEGLTYVPAMAEAARQYELFQPREGLANSRRELEALGEPA